MTGIIVLCRYNSTRLPGKILREIQGRSILDYIVERLAPLQRDHPVIVCTSEEHSDDKIADYCSRNNISCYRGSLDDVANRFLQCAHHYDLDKAVRINGDNVFLDAQLIGEMIRQMETDDLCFLSNVKDRTFPKGMSVEIVDTSYYKDSFPEFTKQDHEHVMTYFYRQTNECTKYIYNEDQEMAGINLAIDTEVDLRNAAQIIELMNEPHTHYGYKEIVELFQKVNSNV